MTKKMLEELLMKVTETAVCSLSVKSALNPMLWLVAVVSVIFFSFAYFFKEYEFAMNALIIAGISPVPIALIVFVYFSLFKPEKLQSEDFQIRQEALRMIKQSSSALPVETTSINQIANPAIKNKGGV